MVKLTQSDKDYIIGGLDLALASAKRLSNRSGQLPFAVDAYKKEITALNAVRALVLTIDVVEPAPVKK